MYKIRSPRSSTTRKIFVPNTFETEQIAMDIIDSRVNKLQSLLKLYGSLMKQYKNEEQELLNKRYEIVCRIDVEADKKERAKMTATDQRLYSVFIGTAMMGDFDTIELAKTAIQNQYGCKDKYELKWYDESFIITQLDNQWSYFGLIKCRFKNKTTLDWQYVVTEEYHPIQRSLPGD